MLIIYGIKARKLAKQENDVFNKEVQVFFYLHLHCQSHLEQFRRVEAVCKLVPQTILQFYVIWYTLGTVFIYFQDNSK